MELLSRAVHVFAGHQHPVRGEADLDIACPHNPGGGRVSRQAFTRIECQHSAVEQAMNGSDRAVALMIYLLSPSNNGV